MVSVVIPYYNRSETLPRALDSVYNQSYKDLEIILVNDGSTDESALVVEEYMQQHPELRLTHIFQENTGPSGARNNGIKIAKGKYIAFLDSDDSWEPSKLDVQIKYMESNPDIAITGTNYYMLIKNRKWNRYALKPDIIEANFYHMLFKVFFATSTVVIRREVFFSDNIWFKVGKNQGEDVLLFNQLLRKHRGVRISKPLMNFYKFHYGEEGGLTSDLSKLLESERDNLRILFSENKLSVKKINIFMFVFIEIWSYLKHTKRVILDRWHKLTKA